MYAMNALIIESKENCQDLVPALQDAGFRVMQVSESSEGIKAILDVRPQLIVVDEEMPPVAGADLVPTLRGLIEAAIITVGNRGEEGLVRSLNQGSDFYMSKPVNLREFIARIRVLLRRYSAAWSDSGEPFLHFWSRNKDLGGQITTDGFARFR